MRIPATVVLIASTFCFASLAHANTINVTTFDDELNSDGDCALREAVHAANTNAAVDACAAGGGDSDIIIIPSGTYTLTLSGLSEDDNLEGDLDVMGPTTFLGDGAATTTIDAHGLGDRIIQSFEAIELQGLTLTGGRAPIESRDGGAVLAIGDITATECVFSDNRAGRGPSESDGGSGGAIKVTEYVDVEITDCVFYGNQAGVGGDASGVDHFSGFGGNGGALQASNARLITVSGCEFIANASGAPGELSSGAYGGSHGHGGAIQAYADVFIVSQSAFNGNAAGLPEVIGADLAARGGAIATYVAQISQSTFTGNFAHYGGAVNIDRGDVVSCTFVDNSALYVSGGIHGASESLGISHSTFVNNIGGGIGASGGATIHVANSIVGQNWAADGESPQDCAIADATLVSYGRNIGGDGTGCGFSDETDTTVDGASLIGVVLATGGFSDHGGVGYTWALADESPAIDTGTCVDLDGDEIVEDGRGMPRRMGTSCDIGAYEAIACTVCLESEIAIEACTADHDTVCAPAPVADAGIDAEIGAIDMDIIVDVDADQLDGDMADASSSSSDASTSDSAIAHDAWPDMLPIDLIPDSSVVVDAAIDATHEDASAHADASAAPDGGSFSGGGGCSCGVATHDARDDLLMYLVAFAFAVRLRRKRV